MPPVVLIITDQDDGHVPPVAKILRDQFECEPVTFSMSGFPSGAAASFECGDLTRLAVANIGDLDLRRVRAIWWRRPERCSAPNEYFFFDKDFIQVECDHFLQGLLWSTPCAWINHPTDEILASRKLPQLAEAARVGLSVPKTIITNDVERAVQFVCSFGKPLITKRIGTTPGSATKTTLITADDRDRLHTVETCPTILQEYIEPGGDVRAVVIGSRVFSFWIESAAGIEPVDSRVDLTVEHQPFELPEDQKRLIRTLLQRLGLVFGVVDMRVSLSGRYYFLEVNPSGQYLYLELLTGVPLSNYVARLLSDPTNAAMVA